MKTLFLQIENRSYDDILRYFMKINQIYCENHNIEYVKLKHGNKDIPYYWWKVFSFYEIMMKRPDIDIIVWMDSDAYVVNLKKHVQEFFINEPNISMFICSDPPGWGSPFMAGVYMVKNNDIGKSIMFAWANTYDKTKWSFINGRWISTGEWAGETYEQGAFVKYIMDNQQFKKHIHCFDYYIFHEINCKKPHDDTFSIHLAGPLKTDMTNCINLRLDNPHDHIIESFNDNNFILKCEIKYFLIIILSLWLIYLFYFDINDLNDLKHLNDLNDFK
jgi:hypothetical protein